MQEHLKNKIEANDRSISELLKDQKFYIDYFQREYRWGEVHMKTLVEDLTTTFLKSYKEGDAPEIVAQYQSYYLGPVVFSVNLETAKKSIIDGQQRITSITLLLIYLNNKQKDFPEEERVNISDLIFSVKHRQKSFNITDDNREDILKGLYEHGEYKLAEDEDETVANMLARYVDIESAFPDSITDIVLPYFIDWLISNVVIIETVAYSDENAYTIFETMNDRGLNLTSTEMLKGYVLSRIKDRKKRNEINDIWKEQVIALHNIDKSADLTFFQAWFRGKYAETIRTGKAGSEDKDFELIGSRFHNWFKDVHTKLFGLKTSEQFYEYFKNDFPHFVKYYIKAYKLKNEFNKRYPHLYYINQWGIAQSLQDPLLLASIKADDDEDNVLLKFDAMARYIETFTVRRSINYRKFSQASIKYTMFNLMKQVRNSGLDTLKEKLAKEIKEIPESWNNINDFRWHGQNGRFVKHFLSRISSFVDQAVGKDIHYPAYYHPQGKQFEIEHIWANKFEEHRDEFDQNEDFMQWRNSIGALILLPNGSNQSYNSDKYGDKLEHYLKENTYAQTLHPKFYEKNPNFLKSEVLSGVSFLPHSAFKKQDIISRLEVVEALCTKLWGIEYYHLN